jgi:hypothetical protein
VIYLVVEEQPLEEEAMVVDLMNGRIKQITFTRREKNQAVPRKKLYESRKEKSESFSNVFLFNTISPIVNRSSLFIRKDKHKTNKDKWKREHLASEYVCIK